ncbi:lytic transglycosylase domain-containing protein [Aliarcobacter butzleri]|uniref:Lytic transglycosylase domain-containing protein n=1 Tax=Aliarcobacter butzleri TaxID=28197 RepID=A0AAW7PZZ4_9BACT|nr:lytic transglycosylase domain-containing protein [Aliarcobacter butzleri]MDN5071438.1 lytic transglycosylase domain-containing protein [Aliarcobacter butzleri]
MIDIAFLESCKNPNVDNSIIQQIVRVESNKNPFSINVNKDGKSFISFSPKTKIDAIKIARKYISEGYNIDIGLMQFNSNNLNLKTFSDLSVDDLLDPCINIKSGSDLFYLAYESTDIKLTKEERTKIALSIYNTGDKDLGFKNGYVDKYNIPSNMTLVSLSEEARKSDTKINLSYSLFNLENLKNKKED